MDILGGKGSASGRTNFMGRGYQQLPIAITVEGRQHPHAQPDRLGQGAIRCHPYVLKEMHAALEGNLAAFDAAFFGHARHVIANEVRAFVMRSPGRALPRLVGSRPPAPSLLPAPDAHVPPALAYAADISMLVLGGSLKPAEVRHARRRPVDAYLASATLKRFEDDGRPGSRPPARSLVRQDALARQPTPARRVRELPAPCGHALRIVIFPLGRHFAPPPDALGHESRASDRALRDPRPPVARACSCPRPRADPLGCLEAALEAAISAEASRPRSAPRKKSGAIDEPNPDELAQAALAAKS